MQLFEKIFQRDDKIFLQFYFFALGIFLYFCSMFSYQLRNGTFELPEHYTTASILLVITFWISGLIKLNEYISNNIEFGVAIDLVCIEYKLDDDERLELIQEYDMESYTI